MTISDLARRIGKFAADNSPTILTTVSVVGTITTAYLAGKASFEASDIIRLKEGDDRNRGEEYLDDPKEVLKKRIELVWRLYVPAISCGAATVTCIIGANRIGNRRAAGLAAAYSLTEKAFDRYKEKVVEKFGEKKEQGIIDSVAQDQVDEKPYLEDVELAGLDDGELCYDMFGDRYFRHTVEGIRSAQNDFNHQLLQNGYGSLSDFYHTLGVSSPAYSESIGWNSDRLMEVKFSTTLATNGRPCISINFRHDPMPDYGRFR